MDKIRRSFFYASPAIKSESANATEKGYLEEESDYFKLNQLFLLALYSFEKSTDFSKQRIISGRGRNRLEAGFVHFNGAKVNFDPVKNTYRV